MCLSQLTDLRQAVMLVKRLKKISKNEKSLKKKTREDVQIKKLISAPYEAV